MEWGVIGAAGGARVKVGSFTVPGKSTGQTVNLGGLPKFMLFSRNKDSLSFGGSYNSFVNSPAAAFLPVTNDTVRIYYTGSSTYIKFSSTGFAVFQNTYDSDNTFYYFAIM